MRNYSKKARDKNLMFKNLINSIGQDLSNLKESELIALSREYMDIYRNRKWFNESKYAVFIKEYERIGEEINTRRDSFYEYVKNRFEIRDKTKLTDKENHFIENHSLTANELENINNNTMQLFGDGFIFIRYFAHESYLTKDNEVISDVADYLHELPFQLIKINKQKKLTYFFIECLKSLNYCSSIIIKNKAMYDSKREYVDFFEKFYTSTLNILQIINSKDK